MMLPAFGSPGLLLKPTSPLANEMTKIISYCVKSPRKPPAAYSQIVVRPTVLYYYSSLGLSDACTPVACHTARIASLGPHRSMSECPWSQATQESVSGQVESTMCPYSLVHWQRHCAELKMDSLVKSTHRGGSQTRTSLIISSSIQVQAAASH